MWRRNADGLWLPGIIERYGLVPVGRVRLVFRDASTGRITRTVEDPNTFVNGGRNKVRDYLAGDAPGYPTHCALSNDGVAVTKASTGVGTEVVRSGITDRVKTAQTLQINTYFSKAQVGGQTVQKAGLVDAAVGGTFFAIATFAQRAVDANETLTVEWTFDLTS